MSPEIMEKLTHIDNYISMCVEVVKTNPTMPRRLITVIEAEIEEIREDLCLCIWGDCSRENIDDAEISVEDVDRLIKKIEG